MKRQERKEGEGKKGEEEDEGEESLKRAQVNMDGSIGD